jgi:hypothetical protein
MTMMIPSMVAMEMCISNCWGNMLMSMLLGAIIAVMVMKYMDHKKKMAWVKEKKNLPESHGG